MVQSDVFIYVIKEYGIGRKKMAPTNAKFIEKIMCERFFDYSLGGYYPQR
jgi:hypothetical protein